MAQLFRDIMAFNVNERTRILKELLEYNGVTIEILELDGVTQRHVLTLQHQMEIIPPEAPNEMSSSAPV